MSVWVDQSTVGQCIEFVFKIDNNFFFKIDNTYKLAIQQSGTCWINQIEN